MAICCKNKIIHLLERFFRRNHIKTTDEAINVVKSFSDAKVLYKKLCRLCHPDKFLEDDLKLKAQTIFQLVQDSRYNYEELKKLEIAVRDLYKNNT